MLAVELLELLADVRRRVGEIGGHRNGDGVLLAGIAGIDAVGVHLPLER